MGWYRRPLLVSGSNDVSIPHDNNNNNTYELLEVIVVSSPKGLCLCTRSQARLKRTKR